MKICIKCRLIKKNTGISLLLHCYCLIFYCFLFLPQLISEQTLLRFKLNMSPPLIPINLPVMGPLKKSLTVPQPCEGWKRISLRLSSV